MSMSDPEWATIANALRTLPSQERWTPLTSETYRTMLAGLSHEAAMRALAAFAMSGEKWRPTWADMIRLAAGTATTTSAFVTPSAAWALVEQAVRWVGCGTHDPGFPAAHQAAIDRLRDEDEAVAAWAAQRGLCGRGSLGAELAYGEYGGAVLKRLEGDYASIRDRAVERLQLGQPAFTERAFLVRGTEHRHGGIAELVESLRPSRELTTRSEAA